VAATHGRSLTIAEWGDPDGFPVFMLHGTPGSRFDGQANESAYANVEARVITYDRPGYGGSDRFRGRRVVDSAADVSAIADGLGIERFAVTGGSWGGPHSLAVAARLPQRVTRAACIAGVAPFDCLASTGSRAWTRGWSSRSTLYATQVDGGCYPGSRLACATLEQTADGLKRVERHLVELNRGAAPGVAGSHVHRLVPFAHSWNASVRQCPPSRRSA
jgi:pimeloyl-ACP methyl ester carboxylesterase